MRGGVGNAGSHGLFSEGQMERFGDLGPELAEHIVAGVGCDADADALRVGHEAALIVWHIGVAEDDGAGGAEPFREIEHTAAVFLMAEHNVAHGVKKSPTI